MFSQLLAIPLIATLISAKGMKSPFLQNLNEPADHDHMCPNGESGNMFRCRSDSSCGTGNHCSEAAYCCNGPAPPGVRRVHLCAAETYWEGVRPKSCQRQADCGKDATCAGFWMDPTQGESMSAIMAQQGGVCCVGDQHGLGDYPP